MRPCQPGRAPSGRRTGRWAGERNRTSSHATRAPATRHRSDSSNNRRTGPDADHPYVTQSRDVPLTSDTHEAESRPTNSPVHSRPVDRRNTLCYSPARLVFTYLRLFDATAKGLLTDADLREVERELLANPFAGAVEAETGGLRKIRPALRGGGKRGGARVLYLYVERAARMFFVIAYPKNVRESLSDSQKKEIRRLVAALKEEM